MTRSISDRNFTSSFNFNREFSRTPYDIKLSPKNENPKGINSKVQEYVPRFTIGKEEIKQSTEFENFQQDTDENQIEELFFNEITMVLDTPVKAPKDIDSSGIMVKKSNSFRPKSKNKSPMKAPGVGNS